MNQQNDMQQAMKADNKPDAAPTSSRVLGIGATAADLDRSRSQLELALQASAVATWTWNATLDSFECDHRLGPMFLVAEEHLPTSLSGLLELIHPEDRPGVKEAIDNAIGGGSYRSLVRLKDQSQGTRWIESIGHAVSMEDQVTGLAGISVDVSDRIEMESENKRLREELAMILDTIPSMVWHKDLQNRILSVNRAAAEEIGLKPQELLGKPTEQLLPPEDAAKYLADDLEVIRSGIPKFNCVDRFASKTGMKWIKTDRVPVKNQSGATDSVITIATDITAIKLKEEFARRTQAYLQKVVDAAPLALLAVSEDGSIQMCNGQAQELFGYNEAELCSLSVDQLLPAPLRERHALHRAEFMSTPSARPMGAELDLRGLQKDGTEIPLEIGLSPIEFENESQVLVAVVDITRRKEQERQLRNYSDQLKIRNNELNEFSYIASHDLQEPLRNLESFTKLLRKDLKRNDEVRVTDDVDAIERSGERMRNLVTDLLTLSRASNAEQLREAVNIGTCIDNILAEFAERITETGAQIQVAEHPVVFGNPTLITQLYQNLISNALRFRRKGVKPVIRISHREEGHEIIHSVADNGIGIKPVYFDKIFVPFKRLHARSKVDGTGIGLAICRKAVERHGGRIWVESTPGEGSDFKFTLPSKID